MAKAFDINDPTTWPVPEVSFTASKEEPRYSTEYKFGEFTEDMTADLERLREKVQARMKTDYDRVFKGVFIDEAHLSGDATAFRWTHSHDTRARPEHWNCRSTVWEWPEEDEDHDGRDWDLMPDGTLVAAEFDDNLRCKWMGWIGQPGRAFEEVKP